MSRKQQCGRYEYDDDEDYVPMKKIKYSVNDDLPAKDKKHTLDSDEEEEEDERKTIKKNEILEDDDIDGQEDATIDFEGETKITPFNMKEELEEGHFDKEGFYHFKKDSELLKDAWMDDIDWVKVKQQEGLKKYGSDVESDSEEEVRLPAGSEEVKKNKENEIKIYRDILSFMKPEENVAKTLKRLGGKMKKLSTAERWKLKKQGKLDSMNSENMADFSKLTDLANEIVESGNMNIYEETYEFINLKIKNYEAATVNNDEPAFDMFSDDVPSKGSTQVTFNNKENNMEEIDSEVMWVYKEKNDDDSKIEGPFSTEKMIRWRDSGHFKSAGVYVRKATDEGGHWYHSSRMQFDLYV